MYIYICSHVNRSFHRMYAGSNFKLAPLSMVINTRKFLNLPHNFFGNAVAVRRVERASEADALPDLAMQVSC